KTTRSCPSCLAIRTAVSVVMRPAVAGRSVSPAVQSTAGAAGCSMAADTDGGGTAVASAGGAGPLDGAPPSGEPQPAATRAAASAHRHRWQSFRSIVGLLRAGGRFPGPGTRPEARSGRARRTGSILRAQGPPGCRAGHDPDRLDPGG